MGTCAGPWRPSPRPRRSWPRPRPAGCCAMTVQGSSPHFPTTAEVLSGETADVYFDRARTILAAERLDPVVTMEIFSRGEGILCGAEEALAYLREIFAEVNGDHAPVVESLHDGDRF